MGVEALIGLSIVSTVASVKEQKKSRRAQARLNKAKVRRQKLQAIAEQRRTAARVRNVAASTGTETSAVAGQVGSLSTQLASNLSFLDFSERQTSISSKADQQASNYQALANLSATVASTDFS